MRVGIDFHPATTHPPGVGRYARELVRALVRLDDRPDLVLYELGREPARYATHELGIAFGDERVVRVARRRPRAWLELLARLGSGVERIVPGIDLVHQVRLPELPLSSRTRVPQSIALAELPTPGTIPDERLRRLLARGALVLAFSSAFEARLRERYDLASGQVRRVPVGAEHWRRELAELPPPDRPARVIVLGKLTARRAPVTCVKAVRILRARGIEAVLAFVASTRDERRTEEIRGLGFEVEGRGDEGATEAHGRADPLEHERMLPELVARSSVLLHLDPEPGTPVTPLEAMALGVPVVASAVPAFVEALGGAARLLDHDAAVRDPELLADALAAAIAERASPAKQDELQQAARPFTWDACARATFAAWREHVQRFRAVQ